MEKLQTQGFDDPRQAVLVESAELLFRLLRAGAEAAKGGQSAEAARLDDRAAELMARGVLPNRLRDYFRRRGYETPEDLVQDVWVTLLTGRYVLRGNPLAFIFQIAHSRGVDSLRAKGKSGEHNRVLLPDPVDDDFAPLPATMEPPEHGATVRQCFAAFAREFPARAELIEFKVLGFSDKEIAAILFNKDESAVTTGETGRVRDRVLRARMAAEPFFKVCMT